MSLSEYFGLGGSQMVTSSPNVLQGSSWGFGLGVNWGSHFAKRFQVG